MESARGGKYKTVLSAGITREGKVSGVDIGIVW